MIDSKHIPMDRNMPLEIIEEILLNLPVKSLRRFTAVSKSWKAMISDEEFLRQHKILASLPGRERILFSQSSNSLVPATTRLLSSISSNRLDLDQLFIWPLKDVKFLASCSDMLWCVASRGSFFVLNPSMGTYKKLPPPLSEPSSEFYFPLSEPSSEFYFGMGFDSVADDYKILKLPKHCRGYIASELYSLRSNSWREIESLYSLRINKPLMKLTEYHDPCSNGVFVRNALHWVATTFPSHNKNGTGVTIISFDLSTEECAGFPQPPFRPRVVVGDEVDLTVLRGKLCLYLNYHTANRFVLWEMQEYGDGKSWTKIMDMSISGIPIPRHGKTILTPLYLYQNGLILMKATTSESATIFIVYEDKLQNIVWSGSDCGSTSGRLYVESFVSPATY